MGAVSDSVAGDDQDQSVLFALGNPGVTSKNVVCAGSYNLSGPLTQDCGACASGQIHGGA
jgi:hypothetical protein